MSTNDERGVESGYPHTLRPELHRALDAAGIDYWVAQGLTFWDFPDGRKCVAYGYQENGKPVLAVKIVGITDPEQVIEATLGRGECQFRTVERFIDARRSRADMCECDRCGYRCARGFIQDERFKYCPNCGRKVVDE